MKFKIKHEKSNLVFMSSVILLCLFTCVMWLILKEYTYFFVYLFLTILISYVYYFTSYYLKENYLVIKLGIIYIKFKYFKIIRVENLENKIKLTFKNFSMNIYPSNKDIFYAEINSRLKGN